uniref:Major sperm protein n=1 Tax=Strongyloides venezuelensis TaxID=75913 RepID=A0A0K0FAB4_STRVS
MKEFPLELNFKNSILFSPSGNATENYVVELKLKNSTKEKQAVKVKCTNNDMFRIAPPVSVIKAGESLSVTLTYNGSKPLPEDNKHYFVIYSLVVSNDDPPRKIFNNDKDKKTECMRLFAFFKKDEGETKNDDKTGKKEDNKDEKKNDKKEDKDDKKEENKDEKKEEKKDKKENK